MSFNHSKLIGLQVCCSVSLFWNTNIRNKSTRDYVVPAVFQIESLQELTSQLEMISW